MKLSKLLSMSILAALALLLTAGSPSAKPRPIPSPRESAQTTSQGSGKANQQGDYDQTNPAYPGTVNRTNAAPNQQTIGAQVTSEDKNKSVPARVAPINVNRDWIDYVNPILTFLLVIVGGLYTIFAYKQWVVARIAMRATRLASVAAYDNAKAALHSNRPYLLTVKVERAPFRDVILNQRQPISRVHVTFRNLGTGPAEIMELVATSAKFNCMTDASEPQWDGLISDQARNIDVPIIGSGQDIGPLLISINWTEEDIELVNAGLKRVGIYGIVRYRGTSKELYYTRFFWWFSPLVSPEIRQAGAELNERT